MCERLRGALNLTAVEEDEHTADMLLELEFDDCEACSLQHHLQHIEEDDSNASSSSASSQGSPPACRRQDVAVWPSPDGLASREHVDAAELSRAAAAAAPPPPPLTVEWPSPLVTHRHSGSALSSSSHSLSRRAPLATSASVRRQRAATPAAAAGGRSERSSEDEEELQRTLSSASLALTTRSLACASDRSEARLLFLAYSSCESPVPSDSFDLERSSASPPSVHIVDDDVERRRAEALEELKLEQAEQDDWLPEMPMAGSRADILDSGSHLLRSALFHPDPQLAGELAEVREKSRLLQHQASETDSCARVVAVLQNTRPALTLADSEDGVVIVGVGAEAVFVCGALYPGDEILAVSGVHVRGALGAAETHHLLANPFLGKVSTVRARYRPELLRRLHPAALVGFPEHVLAPAPAPAVLFV